MANVANIKWNAAFADYNETFEDQPCFRRCNPVFLAVCLLILMGLDIAQLINISERPHAFLTVFWLVVISADLFLMLLIAMASYLHSEQILWTSFVLVAVNWICHIVLLALVSVAYKNKTNVNGSQLFFDYDIALNVLNCVFYVGLSTLTVSLLITLISYRLRQYK